jgi:hypothetical protein
VNNGVGKEKHAAESLNEKNVRVRMKVATKDEF